MPLHQVLILLFLFCNVTNIMTKKCQVVKQAVLFIPLFLFVISLTT